MRTPPATPSAAHALSWARDVVASDIESYCDIELGADGRVLRIGCADERAHTFIMDGVLALKWIEDVAVALTGRADCREATDRPGIAALAALFSDDVEISRDWADAEGAA